jgi:hypothetical protein
MNFLIIKYKKDIENIVKHACYCCKTLYITFQIFLFSKLYIKKLPTDLKMKKIKDRILICNYCGKKIDCGKKLNMTLPKHIINNKSNLKFVPILNKIEECLIGPCLHSHKYSNYKGINNMECMETL